MEQRKTIVVIYAGKLQARLYDRDNMECHFVQDKYLQPGLYLADEIGVATRNGWHRWLHHFDNPITVTNERLDLNLLWEAARGSNLGLLTVLGWAQQYTSLTPSQQSALTAVQHDSRPCGQPHGYLRLFNDFLINQACSNVPLNSRLAADW